MSTVPPNGPESAGALPPPPPPVAAPLLPAAPAPAYGEWFPYGPAATSGSQLPYGHTPAAVFSGAPSAAPRPRTLGLVSMILALSVFVLSMVVSAIVGTSSGRYTSHTSTSYDFNTSDLTPGQATAFVPVALLMLVQILLGTALGILALVLGIVAAATKRGRAFGVVAIVTAAVAPFASFVLYASALGGTLPSA